MKKHMEDIDDLDDILEEIGDMIGIGEQDPALPDPDLLMFYKNLRRREIWLDESIGAKTLSVSRLIMDFNKQDEGIPVEERKPIKIFIYSYGGEVSACFNLIDTITTSKTPVYTYNMGVAMSAAFFILIAGHKRFATRFSTALIHSGTGGAKGTFEQTEAQMKDYKHSIEVIREYTLQKTKIDQKLFNKNKSVEWYIYSEDQLKYGIIDKIIDSSDDL